MIVVLFCVIVLHSNKYKIHITAPITVSNCVIDLEQAVLLRISLGFSSGELPRPSLVNSPSAS